MSRSGGGAGDGEGCVHGKVGAAWTVSAPATQVWPRKSLVSSLLMASEDILTLC